MSHTGLEAKPQSFLLTRAAWLAGELSIAQLLQMPRIPEELEDVPNPEDFFMDAPVNVMVHDNDELTPATDLLRGAPFSPKHQYHGRHAAALETKFRPTLNRIYEHATRVMGVDLDASKVNIIIRTAAGAALRQFFGITHLDVSERPGLLAYIASNRASTAFPTGPFDIPEGLNLFVKADSMRIEDLLKQQRFKKGRAVFQADPLKVVCFDETLPHEVPKQLDEDEELRTSLRVWIEPR